MAPQQKYLPTPAINDHIKPTALDRCFLTGSSQHPQSTYKLIVFSEAIHLRRLDERQSDFNESLDRLYSKALNSQFPKRMVKVIISRAKGWIERKSLEKSRERGELLVWASGFSYLLKLSQRERSLQPMAMITY